MSVTVQAAPRIELLLNILDDNFGGPAWQGPSLRGSVRGLTAQQAAWRPGPGRNSISELVVHAAYWKYTVRRRLLGEKRGSFPRKGSNFFTLPDPYTEEQWRADVKLLEEQHASLREAIAGFAEEHLADPAAGAKWRNGQLLYGVASHDAYHAGQIQLLKRLQEI